jgi:hypothetical protein
VTMPGAIESAPGVATRLIWSWFAEDLSLQPRSGQTGIYAQGGAGLRPWIRGLNGMLVPASKGIPRWEVGDADGDGVMDERTSMLLEPEATNLVENSGLDLDAAGYVAVGGAPAPARVAGQIQVYPTILRLTGVGTTGMGIGLVARSGARLVTTRVPHSMSVLVYPNEAMVGKGLTVTLQWEDAAAAILGQTSRTIPVTRSGWLEVPLYALLPPVGTVRVFPTVTLANDGAGQGFDLVGATVVADQVVAGSHVITSQGPIARRGETLWYDYTRPVIPCTFAFACALNAPGLVPSAWGGSTQPVAVGGIGGPTDVAGGWLEVRWIGGAWQLVRSVGGVQVSTAPLAQPDAMLGLVDVAGHLYPPELPTYPNGSIELRLRGMIAGELEEFASARVAAAAGHLTRQSWSAQTLYLGSGHGGLNPGPWRLYHGKLAAGAGKTFTILDGLI